MISVRGQWWLGVMVGLGLGVMVAKGNGAKLISWCDTIHPPEPPSHKKPIHTFQFFPFLIGKTDHHHQCVDHGELLNLLTPGEVE